MSKLLSNLPIGSLVKDPNSTFLGSPIIWKIADKNHTGYPTGAVTLITERSIAMRAFDAKEPNNSDSNRQSYGNNRYSVSNIRQWLNSESPAGSWYLAQHSADAAPNSSNVWQSSNVAINPYDTNAGFLNGFSQEFKDSLMETNLVVAKHSVDGGGSETVTDKIFLASNTEVGLANENSIVEGSLFPIFSDDASRIAYVTAEGIDDSNYASNPANDTTAWYWWLRTPYMNNSGRACRVGSSGALSNYSAHGGYVGVRPLCNLKSTVVVSDNPDENGIYTIEFYPSGYVNAEGLDIALTKTKEYTDNTFAKKSLYSDTTINIGRKAGTTVGNYSTAEGNDTEASGYGSHAEGGNQTKASGLYSHAEGQGSEATGSNSHAEGSSTKATQSNSHAEGSYTTASGDSSHAEGNTTTASGQSTHAEGQGAKANGIISHAEGWSTIASGNYQHVQGQFNIEDTSNQYSHIVGNGSIKGRSNAHTLDWSGNAWFSGDVYTGSTSGTNKDDGSKKLATEEYVNSAISTNAMPASGIVNNFWIGTQTEYDAIATKSSTTLYMIKEG